MELACDSALDITLDWALEAEDKADSTSLAVLLHATNKAAAAIIEPVVEVFFSIQIPFPAQAL